MKEDVPGEEAGRVHDFEPDHLCEHDEVGLLALQGGVVGDARRVHLAVLTRLEDCADEVAQRVL